MLMKKGRIRYPFWRIGALEWKIQFGAMTQQHDTAERSVGLDDGRPGNDDSGPPDEAPLPPSTTLAQQSININMCEKMRRSFQSCQRTQSREKPTDNGVSRG